MSDSEEDKTKEVQIKNTDAPEPLKLDAERQPTPLIEEGEDEQKEKKKEEKMETVETKKEEEKTPESKAEKRQTTVDDLEDEIRPPEGERAKLRVAQRLKKLTGSRIPVEWNSYPNIELNKPEINIARRFPSNHVHSTKYQWWNFLIKNLFEQFRRVTNIYFLVIVIIVLIPQISPITPITSLIPLIIVLGVTGIKDAYEDYKRYKSDKLVNSRTFTVIKPDGTTFDQPSADLVVGDLVKLKKNDIFPADLVLLSSPLEGGKCFVETAQLDGETNLKPLKALTPTTPMTEADLVKLTAELHCEEPHNQLYSFNAKFLMKKGDKQEKFSLDTNQLLLRGATLKNTPWVIGVVCYAGSDTKLSLNQKDPPSKFSSVERRMNKIVLGVFLFKLICAIVATVGAGVFQKYASSMWFLGEDVINYSLGYVIVQEFFGYFVLFSFLIPMSMMVTLEMVKVAQVYFMEGDVLMMTDEEDDSTGMKAKTSNLNDELALVDYIFSDKTGTLTQNKMDFAACSIGGVAYDNPNNGYLAHLIAESGWKPGQNFETPEQKKIEPVVEFLRVLGLCHGVVAEKTEGGWNYQSSSPDEVALSKFAAENAYLFKAAIADKKEIEELDVPRTYELFHSLDFTSARARMSVIVRTPEGKTIMYGKGADSVMLKRLKSGQDELVKKTVDDITDFSRRGLRTLIVGKRELSNEEFSKFAKDYLDASTALKDRLNKVEDVCSKFEREFELIGCTAIEDKLQDGVPETIKYLLAAGIKLWVITGDKQETAINIGKSTHLLRDELPMIVLNAKTAEECGKLLQDNIAQHVGKTKEIGLVIDGTTLVFAIAEFPQQLLQLANISCSVVCCRVTPLQKAQIVQLVRDNKPDAITLAIGDGANDVSMIQVAHIGVGIFGKEGTQAARASDYAIQQFSHLRRLLTIHGRYSFVRNTKLILSSFYKNMAFFIVQLWWAFFNGFSAQTLYQDVLISAWNITLTSLPPLMFGIFEKDLMEYEISKYPATYKDSKIVPWFTLRTLSSWLVSAVWHSLVVYFLAFFGFDLLMSTSGISGSFWMASFTVNIAAYLIVMLKIALETIAWSSPQIFCWWLSIAGFFALVILLNDWLDWYPQTYYEFYRLLAMPAFYFIVFVSIIIALIPDYTYDFAQRTWAPYNFQILQEYNKVRGNLAINEAPEFGRTKNAKVSVQLPSNPSSGNSTELKEQTRPQTPIEV